MVSLDTVTTLNGRRGLGRHSDLATVGIRCRGVVLGTICPVKTAPERAFSWKGATLYRTRIL